MERENLLSNGYIQPSPVFPGSFIPWRVGHGACGWGREVGRKSLDRAEPWKCLHRGKVSEGRVVTRRIERKQKEEMCLRAHVWLGLLQTEADG